MLRKRGLTFIEVLIVVIVLALLAAIVTPQFSRAEDDTQLRTLKTVLIDVRAQLRLYRTQHANCYPELDQFAEQMTRYSTSEGAISPRRDTSHSLGPYLDAVPFNPYTGGNRVSNGPVGTSDWYYDPGTGLFRANHDPAYIAF